MTWTLGHVTCSVGAGKGKVATYFLGNPVEGPAVLDLAKIRVTKFAEPMVQPIEEQPEPPFSLQRHGSVVVDMET